MASWAIHFRIADFLISKINVDKKYFIIGNIAPDCGIRTQDGYYPSSEVTHRTHCGNYKGNCDYKSIYDEFIKNESDFKTKSFWIGYYVHLLTDCLWVNNISEKIVDDFKSVKRGSSEFIQITSEWHNLDFEYFDKNKSASFELFKTYSDFNENYTEFYKDNEISKQTKNIVSYYSINKPVKMDYVYTKPETVESFVKGSAKLIFENLKELDLT